MKSGKECQKMGEYLMFFRDKVLAIPILNCKYMPFLSNAILTNDGSVPGITLWVRKMISYIVSAKN